MAVALVDAALGGLLEACYDQWLRHHLRTKQLPLLGGQPKNLDAAIIERVDLLKLVNRAHFCQPRPAGCGKLLQYVHDLQQLEGVEAWTPANGFTYLLADRFITLFSCAVEHLRLPMEQLKQRRESLRQAACGAAPAAAAAAIAPAAGAGASDGAGAGGGVGAGVKAGVGQADGGDPLQSTYAASFRQLVRWAKSTPGASGATSQLDQQALHLQAQTADNEYRVLWLVLLWFAARMMRAMRAWRAQYQGNLSDRLKRDMDRVAADITEGAPKMMALIEGDALQSCVAAEALSSSLDLLHTLAPEQDRVKLLHKLLAGLKTIDDASVTFPAGKQKLQLPLLLGTPHVVRVFIEQRPGEGEAGSVQWCRLREVVRAYLILLAWDPTLQRYELMWSEAMMQCLPHCTPDKACEMFGEDGLQLSLLPGPGQVAVVKMLGSAIGMGPSQAGQNLATVLRQPGVLRGIAGACRSVSQLVQMQAVHTAGKLFDAGVHGASDDTVAGSDGAGGGAAATEDASKRLSFKVQFLSEMCSYLLPGLLFITSQQEDPGLAAGAATEVINKIRGAFGQVEYDELVMAAAAAEAESAAAAVAAAAGAAAAERAIPAPPASPPVLQQVLPAQEEPAKPVGAKHLGGVKVGYLSFTHVFLVAAGMACIAAAMRCVASHWAD